MTPSDRARLRSIVEKYAEADAREDLDAQEWGEAMPPWDVGALLDECDRLRALAKEAVDLARNYVEHSLPVSRREADDRLAAISKELSNV